MKKKLVYVVSNYNPFRKDGMNNRVHSFCDCFKLDGYEIIVVACTNGKEAKTVFKKRKELDSSVKWVIMPFFCFPGHPVFNKTIYFFQKLFIYLIKFKFKPDIVLADSAQGIILCDYIKRSVPIIGNYRADAVDEILQTQNLDPSDIKVRSMLSQVRESVKIPTHTICVSTRLKETIENQTSCKLPHNFIFPCCAKVERFQNVQPDISNENIILGYFGGLHKWQRLDTVIDIAIRLRKKDERFKLLVLTASDHSQYLDQLNELGADNYKFMAVSSDDIPNAVSKMDVSFALRDDFSLNRVASPTKLAESFAAGVPLVVTKASGDYREIVDAHTGLVLEGIDISDADIDNIYDFCLNVKKLRQEVFDACRAKVKDRKWEVYASNFIKFLNE